VVRLKVPKQGTTVVRDALRGDVSFENDQVEDQVLLKSDGMPTYHLANVVDDHLMGISHVMRAEEWITSTPKHVLLYAGFGWEEPAWIHMPLLRNQDKSKISKRKNPVSLNYYKEAGFLPAAMLNYLGMMGWTMPDAREKFTVEEMIADFTFERISLGGPVFDVQKLTWLNGLYIRDLTPEQLVGRIRAQILSDEALLKVAPLVRERIERLEDWVDYAAFFFSGEVRYDAETLAAMVPKKHDAIQTAGALTSVLEVIDAVPRIEAVGLEETLRGLGERLEWKTKDLFMVLRLAVTGRKATPPLFDTMAVLGKERCRRRLRQAIVELKARAKEASDG
jgi:glutamyl-tRNA synthetase